MREPRSRLLPLLGQLGAGQAGRRGARTSTGLDFYSRLVDELLEAGILPWLTLYHWDLPQAVEETGGWANRDTARRFLDYADLVHAALGDRVTHWTTFNEPLCSSFIAYAGGEHAPGRTSRARRSPPCITSTWRTGSRSRRCASAAPQQLGITLNLTNAVPNDPTDPVDLDAARRIDALWNRAFLEPLLLGRYPDDFLRRRRGARLRRARARRRPRPHRAADRLPGREPLPRRQCQRASAAGRRTPRDSGPTDKPRCVALRRQRARHVPVARPAPHRRWAGRSTPTASASC